MLAIVLTENPELDLVCIHAADAVVGGADVGAGVLLQVSYGQIPQCPSGHSPKITSDFRYPWGYYMVIYPP